MVILMGFRSRFAVDLNGLLWAEVDASEALGTVAATAGLAFCKGDVALWAHLGTDAAGDASVGIYGRCEQG